MPTYTCMQKKGPSPESSFARVRSSENSTAPSFPGKPSRTTRGAGPQSRGKTILGQWWAKGQG